MTDVILTVKHLNKSYGHQPVLRDVSFECAQGRIVGLVGANGAGKTTIMKAILGLLSTDGEIQIAGETMQLDHHPILATVGSLIEYPSLYPYMSGWDNLRLFADGPDAQARLAAVVSALNMTDYIHQKARHFGDETKAGCRPGFPESASVGCSGRTDEWFGSARY
jgi:ABC-2 type transport system ATP-binding protein